MSSADRITGSYSLDTYGGGISITANNGNGDIYLNGNLYVIGTFSNIKSIDTLISDNIVTLQANLTTGVPVLDAGLEVRRGDECTVGIQWKEAIDRWQVKNDCYTWSNIMVRVEDDADPHLGGHLYTTGDVYSNTNWEIRSLSPHNIVLRPGWNGTVGNTGIQISHITENVTVKANATVLTAREPEAGEAGLYVTNSRSDNKELITKRKALVFALVL
jgi:hypothetical protein